MTRVKWARHADYDRKDLPSRNPHVTEMERLGFTYYPQHKAWPGAARQGQRA